MGQSPINRYFQTFGYLNKVFFHRVYTKLFKIFKNYSSETPFYLAVIAFCFK